ncbi:MAG: PAS-domain containing protein [Burkholderiales bacterium]|nr:PAS-domain containing protein [Burkholderiales bacterium]
MRTETTPGGAGNPAALLDTLCRHFPGGVTVMDADLRLVLWNQRFLDMMGLPASLFEQPITLPDLWRFNIQRGEFGQISNPDELVASFTERALRFEPHRFTRTRPDGRLIEICGEPVAGGGFVTTWMDVTETQRLHTQAARHNAQVTQLVNHLPQGISLFDETLALQLWNQAFIEMLDFPPEAVFQGARFEDLLAIMARRGEYGPGDVQTQVAERLALARRFEAHQFERARPDGHTLLVVGRPIVFENRVGGFITSYTDITAQKTTEQALRQTNAQLSDAMAARDAALDTAQGRLSIAYDQLAQAEKLASLGNLVAGVAHELNTPIGTARLAASTLEDRVRQFEGEMTQGTLRRSALNDFLRGTHDAAALVHANLARAAELIAAFKEVTIDQTSMRRREYLLHEVVAGVGATLAHLLRNGQHHWVVEVPQGIRMEGHPGALQQVLTNLAQNSLLHGFEGRSGGLIRISAHANREQVQIDYEDNGLGMAPEIRRRAFEPFFTTKMGQGGSGLGLHLSHQLVTGLLGGTLHLRSRVGQGVQFSLTLPLRAPDSNAAGPSPAS